MKRLVINMFGEMRELEMDKDNNLILPQIAMRRENWFNSLRPGDKVRLVSWPRGYVYTQPHYTDLGNCGLDVTITYVDQCFYRFKIAEQIGVYLDAAMIEDFWYEEDEAPGELDFSLLGF